MAAIRESMRSPLEGDGPGKDERVILGTIAPEDKRPTRPSRVGVALGVIIALALMVILLVLVPMFWDVLHR
jgi:hypothetical protein